MISVTIINTTSDSYFDLFGQFRFLTLLTANCREYTCLCTLICDKTTQKLPYARVGERDINGKNKNLEKKHDKRVLKPFSILSLLTYDSIYQQHYHRINYQLISSSSIKYIATVQIHTVSMSSVCREDLSACWRFHSSKRRSWVLIFSLYNSSRRLWNRASKSRSAIFLCTHPVH